MAINMADKKTKKDIKKGKAEETDKKDIKAEEEAAPAEGNISEGVLDAFDDEDPVAAVEEDVFVAEEDGDDELDSGDFKMQDEW